MDANIRYEIKAVRFDNVAEKDVAVARGEATIDSIIFKFELVVKPIDDGQWQLVNIGWDTKTPPIPVLHGETLLKAIVNHLARMLDTINMWPEQQKGGSASLSMNQRVIPKGARDKVVVSFRPKMLNVPSASWNNLWDHIERRAKFDPFFEVLGFSRETVQTALAALREVFPESWVRARFKGAGLTMMTGVVPAESEGWFPAYHLARTAQGAICRDPGWNYLIEIALAVDELAGFDGLERLKRQLTKSPGTQHHLCLAAELHKRGILVGLEPLTGAGAATNDLLVNKDGRSYQIEVKEFTSRNAATKLEKEIAKKQKKMPAQPDCPVVFHAVLNEKGEFKRDDEVDFFESVAKLGDQLPKGISAVVAGKRFVDSSGGRVKRDTEIAAINPKALHMVSEEEIRAIFEANFEQPTYPIYGIGTFFEFENEPPAGQ